MGQKEGMSTPTIHRNREDPELGPDRGEGCGGVRRRQSKGRPRCAS